jgi:YHYH protein
MRRFPFLAVLVAGCSSPDPQQPDAAGPVTGCPLVANTTPTPTVTSGCALLERDTSSCEDERRAAGLDGVWLKFSCRVAITKTADSIQLVSDGQPDHTSNYFSADNECHDSFQPAKNNPNSIGVNHMTLKVPLVPSSTGRGMNMGTIGFAINGVSLFNNMAAFGDDIYAESLSFDQCQGHPTGRSFYHYHSEPYSITVDDSNLIGVVMDGYPIYGRRDVDGTLPTLDAAGGHTSATPDSATPIYHYHVNLQTSTTPGTAGQQVYFMTKGFYFGTPGTCEGCQ